MYFSVFGELRVLGLGLLGLLGSLSAVEAGSFTIHDSEGFGQALPAFVLQIPDGWRASGRIAWRKPCTAHHYEALFRATSQDGSTGVRMASSHSFIWNRTTHPRWLSRDLIGMMMASERAGRAKLRRLWQGSNCYFEAVRDTASLVDRVVLSYRSNQTIVVSVSQDTARLRQLRSMIGRIQVPNLRSRVEAISVRLRYPSQVGEIDEEVSLAWLTNVVEVNDPQIGGYYSESTTVLPITSIWARRGALDQQRSMLSNILSSSKVQPEWQSAVRRFQRRLRRQQEARHQERLEQIRRQGRESTARWKERQRMLEDNNRKFIESVIRETPSEKKKKHSQDN